MAVNDLSTRNILLDVTLVIYDLKCVIGIFSDHEHSTYKTMMTKKVITISGDVRLLSCPSWSLLSKILHMPLPLVRQPENETTPLSASTQQKCWLCLCQFHQHTSSILATEDGTLIQVTEYLHRCVKATIQKWLKTSTARNKYTTLCANWKTSELLFNKKYTTNSNTPQFTVQNI